MLYGYIRVSTREQNDWRQYDAMREYGVLKERLYVDKISGKDFERPEYKRMMRRIKKGDTIVIKSLDRLGRSYRDVTEQWRIITKEKGADIKILDMPLLDTTIAKDLIGTLISDLVLQLFSFVAETERDNIRQRQAEGIAAAKARGVKFGRPPCPLPENFETQCDSFISGNSTLKEAAAGLGMTLSTFYRKMNEYKKRVPAEMPDPKI